MTARELWVFITSYENQVDICLNEESARAEGDASRRAAHSRRIPALLKCLTNAPLNGGVSNILSLSFPICGNPRGTLSEG
jgi:hypothetical protein